MAKKNRNSHQKPSQRPAHQQVGVRPGAAGEPELDISRVPSAATAAQSRDDAAESTEFPPAKPAETDSDPLPGQVTDIGLEEDDDSDLDADGVEIDAEEEFNGFEDLNTRIHHVSQRAEPEIAAVPLIINRTAEEQRQYDSELVPIIPRRTQMRVNIGGSWYNLVKGQEQFVPRPVADHFREKGLL